MKTSKNIISKTNFSMLAILAMITIFSIKANAQEIKSQDYAVNISYGNSAANLVKIDAADYKKIKNAESLDLSGNKLVSLPAYIFKMQNLENLSISSNEITDISTDIRKLYDLRVLDLSQTSVQSLPEEISQLKHLTEIHLPYSIWVYRTDEVKRLTNARIVLE